VNLRFIVAYEIIFALPEFYKRSYNSFIEPTQFFYYFLLGILRLLRFEILPVDVSLGNISNNDLAEGLVETRRKKFFEFLKIWNFMTPNETCYYKLGVRLLFTESRAPFRCVDDS
jgi:hypothetical protein